MKTDKAGVIVKELEREPDFVNEKGVKWWLDKSTTDYAVREDNHGISLDVKVFFVQTPDGVTTRMIVDKDGPVYEHQVLEAIAVRIDIMKRLELP